MEEFPLESVVGPREAIDVVTPKLVRLKDSDDSSAPVSSLEAEKSLERRRRGARRLGLNGCRNERVVDDGAAWKEVGVFRGKFLE